jgi:hypothetical protein
MANFFLASTLILFISLLIFSFYWIKQKIKNDRDKKLKNLIQKKYHTNEKEYLRNFISYHLPLLIENDIQWILIWSKLDSNYKTELTFNSINAMVYVAAGNINSLEEYDKELNNLGVTNYAVSYDNSIFKIIPNAKIITDVLYFIFENIYQLKIFSNHKIVTSSG